MTRFGSTFAGRAAFALAAVSMMVTACGSGGAQSNGAASKKVGMEIILTQTGIPYYDPLVSGFQTEGQALGATVTVVGPSAGGASSQIPFIQQAIVTRIAGIAIQPDDPAAPLPTLQQAKAAGAKIIEVNVNSLPQSVRVAAVTALNYDLAAPSQLEELGRLMNYTGDFAILSANSTSVFQNQVIASMQHLLASDPKYTNMHLVKVAYGNDVSATSATQTDALLTEFPNLKAITAPTTVGLAAAAQAVESAGMAKKIIVTGLGEPNEMKKFIKDGTVTEFQLWDVKNMGVVSAYVLYQAINGESFLPGKSFTVPGSSLGTLTVASDGDIPCQKALTTFNASNIDQYNF